MNNIQTNFPELQNWLHMVTTDSSGLNAGIRQAQNYIGLPETDIDKIITSDFGIPPHKRLNIYHYGYFVRLLACLRAEFPKLAKVFGKTWFDEMGTLYLSAHPSNSKSLNELGAQFPSFLEAERPDKGSVDKVTAFNFIIELAHLERIRSEIIRGKGLENLDCSTFNQLESYEPSKLFVEIAPSFKLLKSSFELCQYLDQYNNDTEKQFPNEGIQYITLSRINYQIITREVKAWQYSFLNQLIQDSSIDKAIQDVEELFPDENIQGVLPIWLLHCAELGFFSKVKTQA